MTGKRWPVMYRIELIERRKVNEYSEEQPESARAGKISMRPAMKTQIIHLSVSADVQGNAVWSKLAYRNLTSHN